MALKRIVLRDFIIVAELELEFDAGFSVLTGETGAGKSILVDALQLATGGRADPGAIREGATRTEVSAEFELFASARQWLQDAGFEAETDGLLLRRLVDAQGKSRAWINGSPCTVGQLRELGEQLLDIHGQHAWQSLTRSASVRALLDAYGGIDASGMQAAWADWRQTQSALAAAVASQDTLQLEHERLQWQLGEVDKLAPAEDEWPELNAEHTRLAHAQGLIEAARAAVAALEDGPGGGTLVSLAGAQRYLQEQTRIEPEFNGMLDVLASAAAQVEDVAHSLRAYLRKTDPDPARLHELDQRMSIWVSLARRYRRPPEALFELWSGWKKELAQLEHSSNLDALRAAVGAAQQNYSNHATAVSRLRKKAAAKLGAAVTLAMQGLGMPGGRFEVALDPIEGGTQQGAQHGLENISFLMSGHPATALRPVNKVASGGELSRISLAISVTTSRLGGAQTLIFDEVDAGVGGAVAETVGRLMKQLGADRQVLAVTHLPQVAACADIHLLVSKSSAGKRTTSHVQRIGTEDRISEIARMLGGERLSNTSLAHARELLAPPQL